jgi:hypothetical protein
VLDRDPTSVPAAEVAATGVLATVIGGREHHRLPFPTRPSTTGASR